MELSYRLRIPLYDHHDTIGDMTITEAAEWIAFFDERDKAGRG